MKKNHWYTIKGQSLATFASKAGFQLALYDNYSKSVQEELKRRAIEEALAEIYNASEEQGFDLWGVKKGVYVISLSNPLSIRYRKKRSQVIYIGLGNLSVRLKSHFNRSLFNFMQSLSGADFDFHVACPAKPGAASYYRHVEYCMLKYFSEKYEGVPGRGKFPILNTYAGANQGYSEDNGWWKTPLRGNGRIPKWELSPTRNSDFAPLDARS
ncbi:hypothetical protein [uncultured Parvibaculum sp.]|uniref:hypothetical protein n=1 Tax=uncultured Parvibaculum sp. TaxID=291828 RepID=UPI0030EB9793|tara:strand:- start:6647 stop:7282 length:636 start_codon:yes stop_codon:yes gene_type:complete